MDGAAVRRRAVQRLGEPSSVENVITMSADPAIYGAQMGILANPNLVLLPGMPGWPRSSKKVVRQIALLAGYDPARATGIFTRGDLL